MIKKYIFYGLLCCLMSNSHAIDLYDAAIKDGETIAIYPGAFDPIHIGHDEVIRYTLSHHIADHVIVVAARPHAYKPYMTDAALRVMLISSLYHDEPQIVTTSLNYQDTLNYIIENFKNITLVGIFGSDNYIRRTEENRIPEEIADIWLIIPRDNDKDNSLLQEHSFFGKPMIVADTKDLKHQEYSSTQVRNFLQSHPEFYSGTFDPSLDQLPIESKTRDLIRDTKLYQK